MNFAIIIINIIIIIIIIIIIVFMIMIVINVNCFKLDERTPHGDWASSPFSYPELLAYLMFVTNLMLCTFIYCDFFVFVIIVDEFLF